MRPIERGEWPTHGRNNIQYVFNDWTKAKKHLVKRTGDYCHFCEMRVNNALTVEHIEPRESSPHLSNHWFNFLLACHSCNSSKNKTPPLQDYRLRYYWPHLNNTLLAFHTPLTGPDAMVVHVRTSLLAVQKIKAQALIDLYGLDKLKTTTGDSDTRFTERLETIDMAIALLNDYTNNDTNVNSILMVAASRGFFSIWLEVFSSKPEVIIALLDSPKFKINKALFFDANFTPIPRNPLNADPI
jgi:hypothetical protein